MDRVRWSWVTVRGNAAAYHRSHDIPEKAGGACTVMAERVELISFASRSSTTLVGV